MTTVNPDEIHDAVVEAEVEPELALPDETLDQRLALPDETPDQRFTRVANRRLNVACKQIRLLCNTANVTHYGNQQARAAKMVAILRDEVNRLEAAFSGEPDKEPRYEV